MRSTLSLPVRPAENAATRPPEKNIAGARSRPHDTNWQSDADQIVARALAGQVTPVRKAHVRRHYESIVMELRGEAGDNHV